MDLVQSPAEYRRMVGSVSRRSGGYTTNAFLSREQIERWCAGGELQAHVSHGAALFVRADRDFLRVYHAAEDATALAMALDHLPTGIFVTDLVGSPQDLHRVEAVYAAAGFREHTLLQRLVRVQEPSRQEAAGTVDVTATDERDARDVGAFLEATLDPYAEQIPAFEELAEAAESGRLLVARHDGMVAGMLMYDLSSHTGHLRFWHVDERMQGQGVGRRLMSAFLARCAGAKRLLLWVIGTNARSIAIYRRYGFYPDGLIDRIMIARKGALQ